MFFFLLGGNFAQRLEESIKGVGKPTRSSSVGDSTDEAVTQLGELIKVVLSFICGGLSFNLWAFLTGFILTGFYSTSFILILTYFLIYFITIPHFISAC